LHRGLEKKTIEKILVWTRARAGGDILKLAKEGKGSIGSQRKQRERYFKT